MIPVFINARFRSRPVTGVERFAMEVSSRIEQSGDLAVREVTPATPLSGMKGHAWEQFVLPRQVAPDGILFSPCNTGPISVKRQLVVIHDAAVWDCPEGFSRSFGSLYRQLLPRLAKRSHTVATVSQFSRKQLAPRLGLPEEKILVLGNAVSSAFTPDASSSDLDGSPSLLCVGSMDPRKNLNRLINAWIALKNTGRLPENASLKLIGGTNPKNFAAFALTEDSSIQWLGRVDDEALINHYRKASAFIYPSYYEGFGLPPLEAMACGCPVLISREASLPEVGGPAFNPADPTSTGAALYFDPFSEESIGEAILDFFALNIAARSRLRTNAIARSGEFSWDTIAGHTVKALRRME